MIRHDLGWEEDVEMPDELEDEIITVMNCISEVNHRMKGDIDAFTEEALEEKLDELRLWKNHIESKIESRNESRYGL